MAISLLSIGLISILGQVVLLRELNVSFYGVELIYLLALGIWLFWTAVGAVIGRRIQSPSLHNIALLFIIFAIAIPLDIRLHPFQPPPLWRHTRRIPYLFSAINRSRHLYPPPRVVVRSPVPVDGKGIRNDGQDAGNCLCHRKRGRTDRRTVFHPVSHLGIPELLCRVCLRPCLRCNTPGRFEGIRDIAPPPDGNGFSLYLSSAPLEVVHSGPLDGPMESPGSFGKP